MCPMFLPTPANKRVSLSRSVAYNVARLPVYLKSMCYIRRRIEESGAELVINFYELLTGLTYLLFRPSVPQISIGHQYLFLHRDFEFPDKNGFSLWMLRFFTRLTCMGAREKLALSFREMEDDEEEHIRVVPPLLRRDVLSCEGTEGDYLHGYMVNSGFGENIRSWHNARPEVPLHFFWDKQDEEEVCRVRVGLRGHVSGQTPADGACPHRARLQCLRRGTFRCGRGFRQIRPGTLACIRGRLSSGRSFPLLGA